MKVSRKATATKKPKRFTEAELNNMKLHQLLGVAIKDACILKKSKKWTFNMYTYLRGNGECTGCLAGAVLHRQLGHTKADPFTLPRFARAINDLRTGEVLSACMRLTRARTPRAYALGRSIRSTQGFTLRLEKDLRKLQADLKKADL